MLQPEIAFFSQNRGGTSAHTLGAEVRQAKVPREVGPVGRATEEPQSRGPRVVPLPPHALMLLLG